MRALVTGAAGFIGSHLCETLIAQGHEVVGLDNLSSGSYKNLEAILHHKRFKFKRHSILTFPYEKLFPFDYVFHLAGKADLVPSIEDPLSYHQVNVEGTLGLLQIARLYPPKKFIYAASSTCYGIPASYPTHETAVLEPRHPYGLTKKIGEDYALHWGKVYQIPVTSLRLFNVYGPRARTNGTYGAMFGTFLAQMANDKPVTVVGDGSQKRDFTFVSDVVNGFIKAAEADVEGVFNIGSGQPVSVNQIVKLLRPKETVYIPKRPGEPDITHADITRATKFLRYRPTVDISEGVQIMKEHLSDFKHAPVWEPNTIAKATQAWFRHLS